MLKRKSSLSSSPRRVWVSGALLAATLSVSACNPMTLFESAEPAATEPAPAEATELSASPAEASPEQSSAIVADFTTYEGWSTHDGMAVGVGLSEGKLTLPSMEGINFGPRVPAQEGEFYTVTYAVTVPYSEAAQQYVVGSMYRDAADVILSWGDVKIAETGGELTDTATGLAPAGTATVQLYLGGLWSEGEPYPTSEAVYSSASIKKAGQ